jgi:hypothetical protein
MFFVSWAKGLEVWPLHLPNPKWRSIRRRSINRGDQGSANFPLGLGKLKWSIHSDGRGGGEAIPGITTRGWNTSWPTNSCYPAGSPGHSGKIPLLNLRDNISLFKIITERKYRGYKVRRFTKRKTQVWGTRIYFRPIKPSSGVQWYFIFSLFSRS